MFRNRAAAEWRPHPPEFSNHHWTRTWLALRRSPRRDKIRHPRPRVRRGRAPLPRRHANPPGARSRTTSNTLSEWAHVSAPFPAATPWSSLHWDRTHAEPRSPDRVQVRWRSPRPRRRSSWRDRSTTHRCRRWCSRSDSLEPRVPGRPGLVNWPTRERK